MPGQSLMPQVMPFHWSNHTTYEGLYEEKVCFTWENTSATLDEMLDISFGDVSAPGYDHVNLTKSKSSSLAFSKVLGCFFSVGSPMFVWSLWSRLVKNKLNIAYLKRKIENFNTNAGHYKWLHVKLSFSFYSKRSQIIFLMF